MGVKVTTRFAGGLAFENLAREHRIPCDQPVEAGGENEGPTPVELFLAALGSCAGVYAAGYCKARNLPTEGIEVAVEGEKVSSPARLGTIRIRVHVPADLDEKDRAGIQRAVDHCLIKNTLMVPPQIETEWSVGQMVQG